MSYHILVAPLDWGLGHATRCIPLIKQLQKNGCTVTIAAAGSTKALLANEFPGINIIALQGYNVQYAATKRWLAVKILVQAPKIMLTIKREHAWLKRLLAENKFDAVISDNRFGLYTSRVPSIFITHQLFIQAPFSWLAKRIQNINYQYINRFTACWVPDFETAPGIAGNLSHPAKLPAVPVSYTGPLCRFQAAAPQPVKYSWLVILSGPEPQRTILEQKILAVAPKLQGSIFLVRGKPGSDERINVPTNCTVANHLNTAQMQDALEQAEFVVSRCGYTTVMEMLALGKKTILIPTPGQTEQEYLAEHLREQGWCYSCPQESNLEGHFTTAKTWFNYKLPQLPAQSLQTVVAGFLKTLPISA